MKWTVTAGDCREVMPTLCAESVDSIVTDPPYGLCFMGKAWDHGVPGVEFWIEALRVAKPGAHLLAFGGTRTYHRLACAIEDAGWEIRDCVMWVYGSGFPKSHNLKGDWQGWGTALKPAWEPIIVARKPLCGTVAENVLKHGTGGINVDGCRVGTEVIAAHGGGRNGDGRKYGGGNGIPAIAAGSNPHSGRWPANFIHDGSDEVVGLFPQAKGMATQNSSPVKVYTGNSLNHSTTTFPPVRQGYNDSGSAARFFYCAKVSKADRDEGCEGLEERACKNWSTVGNGEGDRRTIGRQSSTEKEPLAKARNHHPTVKPTALMRYLCRLVTPPDGVVLDPFTGSGSTGKAAILEGFRFIGIEREAAYAEIASARLRAACAESENLFCE